MKFLFDYFPIICFFIAFKLKGIYFATAIAMIISAIQVTVFWFIYRKVEKIHLITLLMILILGGTTLLLHDPLFIKLKPSVIYWVFSIMFFATQWIGQQTLTERLLGDKLKADKSIWKVINLSWALFFLLLGFLNLYVVYHFSTNAWVNFKLFGTLGIMLVFIILQSIYLSKHSTAIEEAPNKEQS